MDCRRSRALSREGERHSHGRCREEPVSPPAGRDGFEGAWVRGGAGARDRHHGASAFKMNRRAASAARTSRANQPAHHPARGPCLRAVRRTQAGADPNRGAGADLDAGSLPDTQNDHCIVE